MQLSLYPNGELRARIAAAPLSSRKGGSDLPKMAETSYLSIVEKLRSETEDPFRPVRSATSGVPGYGAIPKFSEFSVYGRRKIVRAGGLLSGDEARSRTLFLTGTLPGGSQAALEAISSCSGWIVHELLTHLPRVAGWRAKECRFIWVWEWQERGALHWHCIFQTPDRESAVRVFEGFVPLWIRVMESVGARSGIDIAERLLGGTNAGNYAVWRNRAEWARKNPSRYLAKYVSKANRHSSFCESFPPSRWYGISRSLHEELFRETVVACTSFVTGVPDHQVAEDFDLALIERIFGLAHTVRQFPDKVRDGHTFVFYVADSAVPSVRGILDEIKSGKRRSSVSSIDPFCHRFFFLSKVQRFPLLLERVLNDSGSRLASVFFESRRGGDCDFEDLVLLDKVAYQVLLFAGLEVEVKGPKEAQRPFTCQGADTLEVGGGDDFEGVQGALLF